MRRREFVTVFGGAVAVWPLTAPAQQPSQIWRVGVLSPGSLTGPAAAYFGAFRLRLQELGYVEGRNLILDVRRAEGRSDRLPNQARDLVALRLDAIITVAVEATRAVAAATSSIPIVFIGVSQPVERGIVASLARPGGNLTGLSFDAGAGSTAKALEYLMDAVPRAESIAALLPGSLPEVRIAVEAAASRMKVRAQSFELRSPEDLDSALDAIARQPPDALLVSGAIIALIHQKRIVAFATRHRLPAIFSYRVAIADGALMTFGPDLHDLFRRAAGYLDKIFKGTSPAFIPIEQPTKFALVVNLKTAKALGFLVPEAVLSRADEIIE